MPPVRPSAWPPGPPGPPWPPDIRFPPVWGALFSNLVDSITSHFTNADGTVANTEVCVWLDIFAVCQHQGQEQMDDLANLGQVVNQAEETLLVVDSTGQVLTRVWCLFEIWKTVTLKGVQGLRVLAKDVDFFMLKDLFVNLDVSQAQASVDSDRLKLLTDIKGSTGIEAFNQFIRTALVDSTRLEVTTLAPTKHTHPRRYLAALEKSGQMLTLAGAYSDAEPLLLDSLAMSTELSIPSLSAASQQLACLLRQQGKLQEAEAKQRRAMELGRLVESVANSTQMATYMCNLATLLQAQGKQEQAEPLLKEALTMCPKGKNDSMETRSIVNALASLYLDGGRPADALPMYERALQSAQANLPDEDPQLATYFGDLGGVLQDLGQYEKAEELVQQALSLCERKLGHQHPVTITYKSKLGEMFATRGQLDKASQFCKAVLEDRLKVLGEGDPSTATALNILAGWLSAGCAFIFRARPLSVSSASCRRAGAAGDAPRL
eukprot:gene11377-12075_t